VSDPEFRWLSDMEFEQLTAEQKYAYIKKLVEHVRQTPQADSLDPESSKAQGY